MPLLFWTLELHDYGRRAFLCVKDRLIYFSDQRGDALRLAREQDAENLAGALSRCDDRLTRSLATAHINERAQRVDEDEEGDFESLPKWAQRCITTLEAENEQLRKNHFDSMPTAEIK